MAICVNNNAYYVGQDVIVQAAIGCGDTKPLESAYKLFGACTSKSLNLGGDTVDATTDQSVGNVAETLVTTQTFEASLEGNVRITDPEGEDHTAFVIYRADEMNARRQPGLWLRMIFPDITVLRFVNFTGYERTAGTNAIVTFSATFTAAPSEFGTEITATV